jgi:hypothetical protein
MASSAGGDGGTVSVWDETFAIAQTRVPLPTAFAVIQDKTEITVIMDQDHLLMDQDHLLMDQVIQVDRDWKLITFDLVIPLQTIGFLAQVTAALANDHISVCALSSYSTDHILVKAHTLFKALRKLETPGFTVKTA